MSGLTVDQVTQMNNLPALTPLLPTDEIAVWRIGEPLPLYKGTIADLLTSIISLGPGVTLTGTEIFYVIQDGVPIQITINDILSLFSYLALGGVSFFIDGGGSVVSTGVAGAHSLPFNGTITGWTLLADQPGSIVVDVWKIARAGYPASGANSITAAAKPTLTAQAQAAGPPTGWTTTFVAGDTFTFNVNSAATLTWAMLCLAVTKTP